MKFAYEQDECLAYIDQSGCLRIKDQGGVSGDGVKGAICITQNGEMKNGYKWAPEDAAKMFFTGDKLTITF